MWSGGDPEAEERRAEAPPLVRGFRPPTDAAPDASAWRAEFEPGAAYRDQPHAEQVGEAAGWLPRAGAALIDLLIRIAIVVPAGVAGALLDSGAASGSETGLSIGVLVGALLGQLYAPLMIAYRNGQTVGHRATGTRIVMADGRRVSGGRAAVREALVKGLLFDSLLLWLTLLILPALNYLWPLWDGRNETLHDKMCGTRVVKA